MNSRKQQFRDKDIIFREGDPATRAFTIIAGKVELVTEVDGKEKHLALLGPGKTLGDADVARGRHQSTAIAAGTVTLRPLDQQALALVKAPVQGAGAGLLARLLAPLAAQNAGAPRRRFSLFGWFRQIKEASQPADPTRIEIRVAALAPDAPGPEGMSPDIDAAPDPETLILDAFAEFEGVRARPLKKPLTLPEDTEPQDRLNRLHWAARQALAQAEADLLICFEPDAAGKRLTLRFLPLGIQNEDPAGMFHPAQALVLPAQPDPALTALVAAVALTATIPLTDVKKSRLARVLPQAMERAAPAVEALGMAPDMSDRDRTIARLFFANLLTLQSGPAGQLEGYRMAADIYGQAIAFLKEDADAFDRAVAQRALGAILPTLAPEWETLEMAADDEHKAAGPLAQATALLEAAAEQFTRDSHPKEWAALQNRMGHICYRIDAQEGDQDLLKQALNHYQSALQVFNRVDHPMRWAEVMNNIGQAAAILGEQLKSVELFEKAIEACSGALEVRHKLDHPLLWAATQNNLGSALFMLSKQTHDPGQVEAAREAFALAKGVYEARGAHRLTMITEKNLSRVERLMEIARPKAPPPLPWEPKDYAPHLADTPGDEDDDEEEGDMSVYDAPKDDDDDRGLKSRAAGA
ncbi:MAG: cyclic nucleotide-binding domain-containing protein [Rhodospirillales bacterium]